MQQRNSYSIPVRAYCLHGATDSISHTQHTMDIKTTPSRIPCILNST